MNTTTKESHFDVIVIGGGHAGIEACHAAAKMGQKTLLITLKKDTIGLMPCNPSIGGLGKGHIVFEVSALGGLMPKLCNETYLQARMLNTKKGPAVQGLRLQIDKYAYKAAAQKALEGLENLTIYEGKATEFIFEKLSEKKKIVGIRSADGATFHCSSLVVTAGTFLNGLIHIGEHNQTAGRMGEEAAEQLSTSIEDILGCTVGRLKTGTPPRLLRSSLDFSLMERQVSQDITFLFSFDQVPVVEKQPCHITYTNEKTHQIIKQNLLRSAMYSGTIKGIGPRYCPSIEDKIGRYPDKASHHIFVEPEGGDNTEVYPAGLSTSLPLDVQEDYIHSIAGFENAKIVRPGYAVEYDFIQPTHLSHSLEAKHVEGLFFAGQVNGTTGYEEAAGQGVLAGINAALKSRGDEPFTLGRYESYIGVMVDDLVTLGADEPYRMFTSRAERRLLLRQDNAFIRLMPYGRKLGTIDDTTWDVFERERALLEQASSMIRKLSPSNSMRLAFNVVGFDSEQRAVARTIVQGILSCETGEISDRLLLGVHAEVKYDGYLENERQAVLQMKKFQDLVMPATLDFTDLPGLRRELIDKLRHFKPKTIAEAQLIPGMTPAAISLLIFQIKQHEKQGR